MTWNLCWRCLDMVLKIKSANGISYEIDVLGKYTLVIGNSGTGKTYFTDLVSALKDNVVTLQSPLKVHLIQIGRAHV